MPSITLRLEPDMWNVGYDLLATHQKNQMKLDIASKICCGLCPAKCPAKGTSFHL